MGGFLIKTLGFVIVLAMPKPPWNKVPIEESALRRLYEEKRLSIASIASLLNVSGNVVHNRLREHGIPVRSIPEAKELFPITVGQLEDLYFKQRWSMEHIAKHFGCTHGTIVHRFQKYGLQSRGHLGLRPQVVVNKAELEYYYHDQNLSLEQIAGRLHCSKGALERKMVKFDISRRGSEHRKHWRYVKRSFDGTFEQKAYLIGFRLGDLNVTNTNQVVVVKGSTTKQAQANLFEQLFSPYGGVHTTKAKRGTIEQYAFLDRSFDFLLPKQDNIESWITSCPRCFLAFFAGYFDAEGCAQMHKGSHSNDFGGFEVQSYDKNILFQSWMGLVQQDINSPSPLMVKPAGYTSSNGVRNNGDTWKLSIFRKASVWKLLHLLAVDMKHKDKLHRLGVIKQNIVQRNIRRRGGSVIDLSDVPIPLHSHAAHIGN